MTWNLTSSWTRSAKSHYVSFCTIPISLVMSTIVLSITTVCKKAQIEYSVDQKSCLYTIAWKIMHDYHLSSFQLIVSSKTVRTFTWVFNFSSKMWLWKLSFSETGIKLEFRRSYKIAVITVVSILFFVIEFAQLPVANFKLYWIKDLVVTSLSLFIFLEKCLPNSMAW